MKKSLFNLIQDIRNFCIAGFIFSSVFLIGAIVQHEQLTPIIFGVIDFITLIIAITTNIILIHNYKLYLHNKHKSSKVIHINKLHKAA